MISNGVEFVVLVFVEVDGLDSPDAVAGRLVWSSTFRSARARERERERESEDNDLTTASRFTSIMTSKIVYRYVDQVPLSDPSVGRSRRGGQIYSKAIARKGKQRALIR